MSELDKMAGGCVLCSRPDFQRDGFGPNTMIICDQCEREWHVGCLEAADRCHLTELPEGNWFCSNECTTIHAALRAAVAAGAQLLPNNHSFQLLRVRPATPCFVDAAVLCLLSGSIAAAHVLPQRSCT